MVSFMYIQGQAERFTNFMEKLLMQLDDFIQNHIKHFWM